jgi:hypothetical protein
MAIETGLYATAPRLTSGELRDCADRAERRERP